MSSLRVRGWTIVAGLSVVAAVVTGATVSTISIFAVPLTREFELTARQASSFATAFLLGMQLIAPLVGWALERLGARIVMTTGVLLTVAGYVGIQASHSVGQLQCAFALNGIGVGASTYLPASVVCTNWIVDRRGLALGVINAASALGTAAFPAVVGHLLNVGEWRAVVQWLSWLILCTTLPVTLLLVETRPPCQPEAPALQAEQSDGRALRSALRSTEYWVLVMLAATAGFGVTGVFYSIVPYLALRGFALSGASTIFAASNLVTFAGYLAVGMTADRWGSHRVLALVLVSILASIVALLFTQATAVGLIAAALFIVLWGTTSNGVMQLTPMLLVEHVGLPSLAPLMGVAGLVVGIAAALAPSIAGTIFDNTGTYTTAFTLCAACVLASGALLGRLSRMTSEKAASVSAN